MTFDTLAHAFWRLGSFLFLRSPFVLGSIARPAAVAAMRLGFLLMRETTERRSGISLAMHSGRVKLCLLLLIGACAIQAGIAVNAATPPLTAAATEHEIKAAFLFKFLGYAQLPRAAAGDQNAPITVALINADDVADDLVRMSAGRTVDNHTVEVRRITENDSLAGIQVLFIGGADRAPLSRLLKAAQQRSILSITEAEDALDQGSVINFKTVDGKVRFEVSLDAAEKSGVRLSSRLMAVALNVQRATQ